MNIEDEARQEAAQEYAQRHVGGMQPVETIGDRVRAAFEAGAVWRDEKADPEPSDAEVEAAARAMAHADVTNPDGWVMSEEARNVYSDMARAALIAAQEVRDVS